MMLEAVNPLCPENIHVATVTKVKGQHMWLRLEGVTSTLLSFLSVTALDVMFVRGRSLINIRRLLITLLPTLSINLLFCLCSGSKKPIPEIIVHTDSMNVFPVSWCETNGYPLQYPSKPRGQ